MSKLQRTKDLIIIDFVIANVILVVLVTVFYLHMVLFHVALR